jgi:Ni/Co efflux regulator RcnB
MKTLVFAGIATSALLLSITPASASDSFAPTAKDQMTNGLIAVANGVENKGGMHPRMGGGMPGMGGHGVGMPGKPGGHGIGMPGMPGMHGGGMQGGHGPVIVRPRPGSHGIPRNDRYRQPFRGFVLPSYWINPSFSVSNWGAYGLSQPNYGYNWSRYYDDAVLTDPRGYVYDYRPRVNWNAAPAGYAPNGGYQPAYGPSIRADNQVYGWGDAASDPSIEGQREAGTYEGAWTGQYVDPQRQVYRGQWDGSYTNDQGQVYQGSYRGTASGDPVYQSGPVNYGQQPAPARDYDDRDYGQGPQGYETCLRSNGVTGAALGAVLGGVAGNRIAGRGNRLGGSLLGAGLGGIAGSVIEKATSRCKRYQPREEYRPPVAQNYPPQYYPAPAPQNYPTPAPQPYPAQQQPYGYGWQGGYYYPQPATTTVTVVPGNTTTTTTTSQEVVYETVYVTEKRRVAPRTWKPKPRAKPRPTCYCR